MAEEENEVRMTGIVSVTTENMRSEEMTRAENMCETVDNQVKGTENMGGNSECESHGRAENVMRLTEDKATVEICREQEWIRENERWMLSCDMQGMMGMGWNDEEKNQLWAAENSDGGGSGGRYDHWGSGAGSSKQLRKGERAYNSEERGVRLENS
ncbi:hypothetical protein Pmani_027936 [Petrolisthes manimaculis]|uniref:Uncharacterized protein n=1 Tax=Petrolisthes manimaculis TaxID=1843537 RepID=A0AAE1TYK6_9EUCA|nr:hypothetical protein Pmani_027936 [Petrolisthes manimaculis]